MEIAFIASVAVIAADPPESHPFTTELSTVDRQRDTSGHDVWRIDWND